MIGVRSLGSRPGSEHRSPEVGFPIRKSADQSLFAAPRGLSQRTTSFIASQRQGIHRMPLRHLIALMLNAHSPALARGPGHCSERPVSCLDSSVTPAVKPGAAPKGANRRIPLHDVKEQPRDRRMRAPNPEALFTTENPEVLPERKRNEDGGVPPGSAEALRS